ncbi:MAG TPA: hypothetical protein VHX63_10870 [Acidobacteriaceae bacterium]|nr:hypothetical protein [Acidobacteriaceae bacterium]
MKITIDNQNGLGPIDYSAAICADKAEEDAVLIQRSLNEPSLAKLLLDCTSHGLPTPVHNAAVVIEAANGTILFTGYVPTQAEPVFAGYDSTGARYRMQVHVVSDDWLLDRAALPQTASMLGQTAGDMVRTITTRVSPTLVNLSGVQDVGTIGFFEPQPNLSWSENVAALANQARAAYRVVDGQLTLAPVGSTVHTLSDTQGTVDYSNLTASAAKTLVNDVTVTGLSQPMEYVTELFEGDGATVQFQLQREPFPVHRTILLDEEFTSPTLNTAIWTVSDSGGYLNVSGAGLTLTGGAGTDGTTTLTTIDPVEMGGEIVVEAGFVQINSGSDGVLCGLYSGTVGIPNCLAGFRVRPSGGNTILVPLVEGSEVGTTFTIQAGHTYILRIRTHSTELQRLQNSYFSYGSSGAAVYGGGMVAAPLQLLFELQDMALLPYVNIGSTILYDGALATSPGLCYFGCVNSVNLQGSVGYFKVSQPGTIWATSTPSGGTTATLRIGQAIEGADCNVLRDGFLYFYKLATPQPGTILSVTYRVAAPSVARMANAASVAQEGVNGIPGVSQWIGRVVHPPARSSLDCENACQALLNFSANPSAGWTGKYSYYNLQDQQDIWPGDALNFQSATNGFNESVIVRSVSIASTSSSPEVLNYTVEFANDWAETLSMKLSDAIPVDVILPTVPETAPGAYLQNLNSLQVTSITTTAITVAANITPPANGGFEVRWMDNNFGPDVHEDLVLRSPVPNFTIVRSEDQQQFYIRMYDGSTPPLYSRISAAIFTNVPTQ